MVSYTHSIDKQGRPRAARATLAGEKPQTNGGRRRGTGSIVLALVFLAVLAGKLPVAVLAIYLGLSVVTFAVYAMDKSAAKRDSRRTPENTLQVLALAGGWPGALLAQQSLRHKSSKQSFRLVFWITVLLNAAAFTWLFTAAGTALLQSLLQQLG